MRVPDDFRGELPLTDIDFARIRRNVMGSIARRATPRFSLALRFAVAMMVAAFAGVISYRTPEKPQRVVAVPPAVTPNVATGFSPSDARLKPGATLPTATPPQQRSPKSKPRPVLTAEPAPEIRLEIQTSDPDVRIIWITNQSNEEES